MWDGGWMEILMELGSEKMHDSKREMEEIFMTSWAAVAVRQALAIARIQDWFRKYLNK